MTKRQNKRNSVRRINPLMRRQAGVPRPRLSFDGQILNSTTYVGQTATNAAALVKERFWVSCHSGVGASRAAAGVTGLYNEYKFRFINVEWIPSISPASVDAGSRIHIAYIDNPEKMVNFEAAPSDINSINLVRSVKNCRTYNAWERFTYSVPLTYRRKLFDVDTNDASISVDDADRTAQGQIQIGVESVTPAAVLGTYRVSYGLELHGLTITQLT